MKPETRNLAPEEAEALNNPRFNAALRVTVPVQIACFVAFLYVFEWHRPNVLANRVGLIPGSGLCCGILGIYVVHEMGRRKETSDQIRA